MAPPLYLPGPSGRKASAFLGLLLLCLISPESWAQGLQREESMDYYRKWLDTDVVYLISDEERAVFQKLSTEDERQVFIENFWRRRDPDPRTSENEFKTEHYRRIAYANEKFTAGMPGWRTDRGKMYIKYGPPAEIDVYPTGTVLKDTRGGSIQGIVGAATSTRPREVRTFPFEVWRYRYLEGLGSNIEIEFVDKTGSGIYQLAMDPDEKNVFGFKDPAVDVASPVQSEFLKTNRDRQFNRTELFAALAAPPPVHLKDLQEVVSSRVHYDDLNFSAAFPVLRVSDQLFHVPVAINVPAGQLEFDPKGDIEEASIDLFVQATNVQKRIVAVAEQTLTLHGDSTQVGRLRQSSALYQKKLALPPGRYVIDVVVKDNHSEKMGTLQQLVVVEPTQEPLSMSSLIVADAIQQSAPEESPGDPFVIGTHKVIPNVGAEFLTSESFGLFFQVYGLKLDQSNSRPDVEMRIRFKQQRHVLLELVDDLSRFGVIEGKGASVSVSLPLQKFPEGRIDLEVEVVDRIAHRSLQSQTSFRVSSGQAG